MYVSEEKAKTDGSPLGNPQHRKDDQPKGVLAKRGPIPNHILDAIAILSLSGARAEDISVQVGLPVKTVTRLVTEQANHKFNAIVEGYREKLLKHAVQHKIRLGAMMEYSYNAYERALTQDRDLRLAKDTAKDVFEQVVPSQQRRPEQVDVNVGFQSIHLQQEVNNSFGETAGKFAELLGSVATLLGAPDPHTKKGPEALPSAYEHQEPEDVVLEAEFTEDGDSRAEESEPESG